MKTLVFSFVLLIALCLALAWTWNKSRQGDFYYLKLSPEGIWYYHQEPILATLIRNQ